MKNSKKVLLIVLSIVVFACSKKHDETFIVSDSTIAKSNAIFERMDTLNLNYASYIDDNIIIINNIIFDDKNKTYGVAPKGGFIQDYRAQSKKNEFDDWSTISDNLTPASNVSKGDVLEVISLMRDIGITDVYYDKDNEDFVVQWGSSEMHGFSGLIVSKDDSAPESRVSNSYDEFKQVRPNVYYFVHR